MSDPVDGMPSRIVLDGIAVSRHPCGKMDKGMTRLRLKVPMTTLRIHNLRFRTLELDGRASISTDLSDEQASGVYAYEFTDGMWYVGKSVDVRARHVQHMHEYRHEDPPRVPKRMLWAEVNGDGRQLDYAETLVVRKGDDYDPRPLGFVNMKLPEGGKLPTWQDCGVPDYGTLPNAIAMRFDTLEEGERLLHAEHALDACYRANSELIRRGASTPYSATGRARPLTAASRASPSVCPS